MVRPVGDGLTVAQKTTCVEIATEFHQVVGALEHPEEKRAEPRVHCEGVVEIADHSEALEASVQEARAGVFDAIILMPLYFMSLYFYTLYLMLLY